MADPPLMGMGTATWMAVEPAVALLAERRAWESLPGAPLVGAPPSTLSAEELAALLLPGRPEAPGKLAWPFNLSLCMALDDPTLFFFVILFFYLLY
jgi:hypothetical protein